MSGASDYSAFLANKSQLDTDAGFEPLWLPDFLFDFQRALVEWAVRKGRCAIFSDCGTGKSVLELVWAENVVRKTNGRVLLLTPLAVGAQMVDEGAKFGVETHRTDVIGGPGIYIANYERLHYYNAADFVGAVCDESSILKNFDGVTKAAVTEFLRTLPYRLLCTATAAPNDYVELGTSSEALGYLGHMDMLNRFFVNDQNTSDTKGQWKGHGAPRQRVGPQWRFKGHAEQPFWRWVCSWARALRKPSDLGFDDGRMVLPPLREAEHVVAARRPREGMLFSVPAVGLAEQREERRRTLQERCEMVAALVAAEPAEAWVVWCDLNDEADTVERLVPGSVQVSGSDSEEWKENVARWFAGTYTEPCVCAADAPCTCGKLTARRPRVLVSKSKIYGFGLNFQACARVAFVGATHSYESYYQSVRRCWRFGQTREVVVHLVTTDGDTGTVRNLRRKAAAAEVMFEELVRNMRDGMGVARAGYGDKETEVPRWLCSIR